MLKIESFQNLPQITIRSYRENDFDAAYKVIREIGSAYLGSDLRSWDRVFTEPSGFMCVATVDDTPVAFAGMSLPSDGLVYLHTDLVARQYQRRGIGTVLTLARFASLPPDEVDRIGVLATEHSAPFYARFGFLLEAAPQVDPFAGYHLHRMSLAYTSDAGDSANALLEKLQKVKLDAATDADPSFESESAP